MEATGLFDPLRVEPPRRGHPLTSPAARGLLRGIPPETPWRPWASSTPFGSSPRVGEIPLTAPPWSPYGLPGTLCSRPPPRDRGKFPAPAMLRLRRYIAGADCFWELLSSSILVFTVPVIGGWIFPCLIWTTHFF